jgi:hypothetical protein
MDLPGGAFGVFLLESVRLYSSSSCPSGRVCNNPSSKDLTGTAKTTADEKETKLAAAFHAVLK